MTPAPIHPTPRTRRAPRVPAAAALVILAGVVAASAGHGPLTWSALAVAAGSVIHVAAWKPVVAAIRTPATTNATATSTRHERNDRVVG